MVRTLFPPRLNIHSYRQRPLVDLVEHKTQHTTLLYSVRVHVKSCDVPYENKNKVCELSEERECAKIQE